MFNRDKTVFIEYSSSEKGQHFMTVVQVTNGNRQIIGRIYREYDKENKKTNYHAVDWAGTPVFVDFKDLSVLKQKFIENGKHMTMSIPKNPNQRLQGQKDKEPYLGKFNRDKQIKQVREQKTTKKVKGKEQEKTEKKEKENEVEKVKPSPEVTDKDKELKETRQQDTNPEIETEQKQEGNEAEEKTDRDRELEEVRGRDDENDREQDQEVEIDM